MCARNPQRPKSGEGGVSAFHWFNPVVRVRRDKAHPLPVCEARDKSEELRDYGKMRPVQLCKPLTTFCDACSMLKMLIWRYKVRSE